MILEIKSFAEHGHSDLRFSGNPFENESEICYNNLITSSQSSGVSYLETSIYTKNQARIQYTLG